MKKRLIALTAAIIMLLTLVVGCAGTGTTTPSGDTGKKNENNAQLVIAMNPILVYDDNETVIAYNDVKNAIKADFEGSTLTTLNQSTAWQWVYKTDDAWKKRAIYTLDKWTNGAGVEAKTAYSYSFNNEGTTSLASYYAQSVELTPYGAADSVPDYGLLLSVTGNEEEAVAYTVQKDGVLNIAEGVFTAVQSVAGVNTGFLAEDGTARSASVRVLLNNKQVFSGTLCNSTASENGTAVTSLAYDQISDMAVTAGDVIFIAVRLNAAANTADDQSAPAYNEDDNWTTVGKEVQVPITSDSENEGVGDTVVEENQSLSIFDGFDSRFVLVRPSDLDKEMAAVAAKFRENMEFILDTEVLLRNESHDEKLYEIIIGPMEARPESLKVYEDLTNYRANNANDFIIRRVGTKVYLSANNTQSMESAIDYFLKTFCSSEDGAIPANYNYAHQGAVMDAAIAGTNIGNYVISLEKYPSTIVQFAAEELQTWVKENCGYLLPIVNLADDLKHAQYEIQVGPQNGSVKVERAYDTRFTNATTETTGQFKVDPNGYLTGVDGGYYKASISGKHLVVNGGTAYAVSAAMTKVCADIKANKGLPAGYSTSGTYRVGNYDLIGKLESDYDLVWQEDFSYDTSKSNAEINEEVREYWTISGDTTNGPTAMGVNSSGDVIWDQQRRPGVYGENWWIWNDKSTGNGYLLEITKKESYGYDAGRLISQNKWSWRYGIWETRIVVGTRNGACSAVWGSTSAPDNATVRNEIDVYENFGSDKIVANYHTWAPDNLGGHINHNSKGDMEHATVLPVEGEHFWDTFHSISVEWTSTQMDFYWDGDWFDGIDLTEIPSGQASNTIKFANGVGTGTYSKGRDPYDWMNAEYTAETGKTVEDFFEVQTIDFSYILQTNPEGQKKIDQSYMKYARTHPNSEYYSGSLADVEGWTSAQLPK